MCLGQLHKKKKRNESIIIAEISRVLVEVFNEPKKKKKKFVYRFDSVYTLDSHDRATCNLRRSGEVSLVQMVPGTHVWYMLERMCSFKIKKKKVLSAFSITFKQTRSGEDRELALRSVVEP